MNSLQLINTKKEFFLFFLLFLFIFLFNLSSYYQNFLQLKKEEIYAGSFEIVNIYDKGEFYVLKLKNADFSFFTSISKNIAVEKLDFIDIAFITKKINFYSYLKGFYVPSLYYENYKTNNGLKKRISNYINHSHSNTRLQELFNALFLAIPISKENRAIYTNLSISHLIAISGFHLAILVFLIYWMVYFPYNYFHKKYFIYRNKKYDILLLTIFICFGYLYLTDIVASLLRSFIMFAFGVFLLRCNIKVLSYNTLFLTLLFIVCLFPKYLFSISLWFSIIGVFYIFLYVQYFKNLPKLLSILFFNFWIFLVFNPIVHFFFYNTSYEQFLSPIITLLFTLFYPFELFLHLIGQGGLVDDFLIGFWDYKIDIFEVITPLWFFLFYIILSFVSIFRKEIFVLLNFSFLLFNINIYLQGIVFSS